ncbi:3-isopropylmalate dehydratase small subunit [Roseomonas sp. PWR1]|uniref:3-isopropylmalate dehydratase small subunit n=1 Tax=Roseomonas nitratireducens TaxID=2820810 RepID=A0ABS4ATK1_9PROT|nr:3-isopropylmalate dehydratase small subunit [Neoroseomonas nitratireducens]MBP0464689.1 3-isopropylmalate dehydratase small subunit [Neoroseomonas nitratireducens]
MDKVTTVAGPAVPMLQANIDTDVIIPIQRLVGTGRTGLGPHAFERLRYLKDGSDNPDFVLNRAQYRGSPVLLAGPNFGCGSSREGAVWALMGMGVRAVIAPSFGDIFFNNCFQNGLLPVALPEDVIRRIAEETEASQGSRHTTVDLVRQVVVTPEGAEIPFAIDPRRRESLLEGLDDIALTLRHKDTIAAWQKADRAARAWAWESVER